MALKSNGSWDRQRTKAWIRKRRAEYAKTAEADITQAAGGAKSAWTWTEADDQDEQQNESPLGACGTIMRRENRRQTKIPEMKAS